MYAYLQHGKGKAVPPESVLVIKVHLKNPFLCRPRRNELREASRIRAGHVVMQALTLAMCPLGRMPF